MCGRRLAAGSWARDGIETVNFLYGAPEGVFGPAPVGCAAAVLNHMNHMNVVLGFSWAWATAQNRHTEKNF